jgi:hypothetical protein
MWKDVEQKPFFNQTLRDLLNAYPNVLIRQTDEGEIDSDVRKQRIHDLSKLTTEVLKNLKDTLDANFITLKQLQEFIYKDEKSISRVNHVFSNTGLNALKTKFITIEAAINYNPAILNKMLSKEGIAYLVDNHIDPNDQNEVYAKFIQPFEEGQRAERNKLT